METKAVSAVTASVHIRAKDSLGEASNTTEPARGRKMSTLSRGNPSLSNN